MTEDRFSEIDAALDELRARSDAHKLILGVIIGQISLERGDWRDRLDVIRLLVEGAVGLIDYSDMEPSRAEKMRAEAVFYAAEIFQAVREALLEADASAEPGAI
jgi:hypothetical protein